MDNFRYGEGPGTPGSNGRLIGPGPHYEPYRPAFSPRPDEGIGLSEVLQLVSKRRFFILGTLFGVMAVVAAYTKVTAPVWRADTLIRIQEDNTGPTAALFPDMAGESQLETEMLVVVTRPVLGEAVEALGLNLVVLEPKELPREVLLSDIDLDRDTRTVDVTLTRLGPDRYRVQAGEDPDRVVELEVASGQPISVAGGSFSIAPDTVMEKGGVSSPPERMKLRTIPFDEAVDDLREALSVQRPDRNAGLFRISLDAQDRWLARDIVNEVTTAFIDQGRDLRKAEARSTVAFLQEQSQQIQGELSAAEQALRRFRESHQVVSIETEAQEQVHRLAQLQTDRASLAAERDALASLFSDIQISFDTTADFTRLVAFPPFRQSQAIQALVVSLLEAETNRTELRSRWSEDHPGVIALDRQIDQLKSRLEDIGENYLNSLESQITSLDSETARFRRDLGQIPARELEYARLERQTALLTDLYSTLRQRLKEAEVRAEVEESDVLVAESAVLPREPVRPRPVRYMILGVLAGGMLGLAGAFVREQLDTRLRKDDDVAELLGLSVLSQVPRLAPPDGERARPGALVAVGRGPSLPAEAFRNLRTSVFFAARNGDPFREILVTSPGSREGKSTTCCNVAITLAQQGLSTLLVDCDLRRGSLHRVFNIEDPPGLSEFLNGQLSPGNLVRPTGVDRLSLVPAGRPTANPSELLGSPNFDRFLASARRSFDVLIVDSPPVLPVTDAVVLATKLARVVLVVRTDRTHRRAASDAVAQLQAVGATVLGVVVNDTPGTGRYGYYKAYYEEYLAQDPEAESRAGREG